MSFGVIKLFENAEALADGKRFVPAIRLLEKARRQTELSDRRAWASYNLGSIYWHGLGDGLAARREFFVCIDEFERHGYGGYFSPEAARTMHANAMENAMLCALSFNEFETLAARLQALKPDMPILANLVPEMRTCRDRGVPWSHRLFGLAETYYNRNNPTRDVGRYGEAKSTYHLILAHRRDLRLSRVDWRLAVFEFCVLAMRMTTDCVNARGGDDDPNPADEFFSILTDAIPEADEYLKANPGDEAVRETRDRMEKIAYTWSQRPVPRRSGSRFRIFLAFAIIVAALIGCWFVFGR